jgi:5-formyltetrahydrofolate cyclo-ligase
MPQLPVRRRARRDGKTLYIAVPRLAEDKPFVRVAGDPTINKALAEGVPARVEDLGHVDLVVCGTVAVNHPGVRVGKGGGYSDLELGLLVESVDAPADRPSQQRGPRAGRRLLPGGRSGEPGL